MPAKPVVYCPASLVRGLRGSVRDEFRHSVFGVQAVTRMPLAAAQDHI